MSLSLIQNKVDVSVSSPYPDARVKLILQSMTEQEQKAFKMYGKVPAKNLLTKMQKV